MKIKGKQPFFRVIFRVIFPPKKGFQSRKKAFLEQPAKTPKALENKGKIQYFQGLSNLPAAGLEPAQLPYKSRLFRLRVIYRVI